MVSLLRYYFLDKKSRRASLCPRPGTEAVPGEVAVLEVRHVTQVLTLEAAGAETHQVAHQTRALKTRRVQRVVEATVEALEGTAKTGTEMRRHQFILDQRQPQYESL